MKKAAFFSSTLCIFAFASSLMGQTLPTKQMNRLFEEGRSTLQLEVLERLRSALEPCANTLNADFACRIRLARTCYYLSFAYELQKQRGPGEKALEQ